MTLVSLGTDRHFETLSAFLHHFIRVFTLWAARKGLILRASSASSAEISSCRVSIRGVISLGGHFACLCRAFEFYEVKKKKFVIIFQKENGNTFTLLIIFILKILQKEQKSTNLLLWPPICRNKSAINPKWFNSLDTNSRGYTTFSDSFCWD